MQRGCVVSGEDFGCGCIVLGRSAPCLHVHLGETTACWGMGEVNHLQQAVCWAVEDWTSRRSRWKLHEMKHTFDMSQGEWKMKHDINYLKAQPSIFLLHFGEGSSWSVCDLYSSRWCAFLAELILVDGARFGGWIWRVRSACGLRRVCPCLGTNRDNWLTRRLLWCSGIFSRKRLPFIIFNWNL